MNKLIVDAIKAKKSIEYWYGEGMRKGEPHCYGKGNNENDLLRIFQTEGVSASGNAKGWKLLKVEEMKNIKISEDSFGGARPAYNPNDPTMQSYYARV